jgi:hypothetical protein
MIREKMMPKKQVESGVPAPEKELADDIW